MHEFIVDWIQFPLTSFFAGAKTPASFPPEDLPEVAVVGKYPKVCLTINALFSNSLSFRTF